MVKDIKKRIRSDFLVLSREIEGKTLSYLDNSATSLKPKIVIDEVADYYKESSANVHRGIYRTSIKATEKMEETRALVAEMINSSEEEIVFTRGTTESLNAIATMLEGEIKKGDEILISKMEHHSNIVPWQQLAKKKGAKLVYIGIKDMRIDKEDLRRKLNERTKIVSIIHTSNVLGTTNDAKSIFKIVREMTNAYTVLDCAQSIPHIKVDAKDIGCDFLAFSSHKMCGPTGVGVMYAKKEHLLRLPPFMFGGDMISKVTLYEAEWSDIPYKFEAGTPNISGIIGFGAAIRYLKSIGYKKIKEIEEELFSYMKKRLKEIEGIYLYLPERRNEDDIAIISFNIEGIHPHDIASILDTKDVAVRAGHHCAMPLMHELKIEGCIRASIYLYNDKKDIDNLIEGLKEARRIFS